MRSVFPVLLLLFSLSTNAQKVECRNDSIFVNSFYINGSTGKSTLDSILKSKGKIKHHLGHDNTKAQKTTSYNYNNLGLIFSKYDSDSTKLSIAIKLNRNSDPRVDMTNMATDRFKGDLFFANNYINEKKRINQLQELKDCKITYYKMSNINVPNFPFAGIYSANIVNQKTSMHVLCDIATDEITTVSIRN
jgi:hypothetical protein